ncbi:hypothetical protein PF010_g13962 [Phytophthora fragariae]|uniref:Uncharacterized protein n=1 Tax=Phytophthora fragariae TaxID=53985 RepID=A0A6A3EHD8_9STRA|nr:hypothetical protein PF009_g16963 [Phytophthora fragariae]KAE9000388.1 hypothetical protein PF011_g14200 [Phytophthora fragariae]KAE9099119.1 hypothetical protein PF007_g15999 [Phytophthora fragariae]KAE9102858.1 hypothetical protein PF010_g13962 [Phytophthora fragariae]KAE9220713.1 hypothetical protein PF004_g13254 [Phytophthora fragariae]
MRRESVSQTVTQEWKMLYFSGAIPVERFPQPF